MGKRAAMTVAVLLLGACATKKDTRADHDRVEARLQQYSHLVLAMDTAGMAAMFAPEGEMVNPRQPAVKGREAIRKFLDGYSDYKVLSNADLSGSVLIDGDTAEQLGTYRQEVRSPQGKVFEASGRLEVAWIKDSTGEWLIQQLETFPN
jgi:ketosteroid isomerase-like protein